MPNITSASRSRWSALFLCGTARLLRDGKAKEAERAVLAFQTRETGQNLGTQTPGEVRHANRAVTVTPDFRKGVQKGRLPICTVGDSSIAPGQRFSSSDVV